MCNSMFQLLCLCFVCAPKGLYGEEWVPQTSPQSPVYALDSAGRVLVENKGRVWASDVVLQSPQVLSQRNGKLCFWPGLHWGSLRCVDARGNLSILPINVGSEAQYVATL